MKPGSLYKQTTIVLAEDHFLVRQGFKLLLETEKTFRLAGEAGDGLEACELVERLSPDVLVLDLMIPRLHGLEVTRRLHKSRPKTRIIILSMHAEEAYVIEALRNGALGYVLKDSTPAELVTAVRTVVSGKRYLSPPLVEVAIHGYIERPGDSDLDAYDALTSRERVILQMAAEGHNNPAIAKKLFVSVRTVETHRANLLRKLALHSQTDLVRFAIRRGIIQA
jgi:DNA-binding NarL/FixJ family response regulator